MDKLIIAPGTDPDQFYATDLQLHTFITLVRGKRTYVAAGGFEYPQAKARFPNAERFEDLGKDFKSVVKNFCSKHKVKNPVMPASTPASLFRLVKGAQLTAELFPQRQRKRKDEIRSIREMQRATEDAITAVRGVLSESAVRSGKAHYNRKPLTSEYLKQVAAIELAKHDCSCPEMIISSGKQTALPHHRGSGVIKEGPVIVDIFPRSHGAGYYSDCTRTFVVGKAPKDFDERYAAVLAVQKAATKLAKHGAKNIDTKTRRLFEESGFLTDRACGTGYIHGLGHGVGLEIHESPRLSGVLKSGNVITIEPGLYYDYGIRVEDIGLVTRNGFSNFTKLNKNPYTAP